jgi:hypothetical protein
MYSPERRRCDEASGSPSLLLNRLALESFRFLPTAGREGSLMNIAESEYLECTVVADSHAAGPLGVKGKRIRFKDHT